MPKQRLIDRAIVSVPFPRDQRDRLVALAKREQRGVSNLIRLIVTDYLEKAC